jgi:histidyl-tRNA synthetase
MCYNDFQTPKGTHDILPQDAVKWQQLENIARLTASLYNCKEIRTPIFEHTELFLRGLGDNTDVVSKEMYSFLDKGNRSLTLKPEGTAPVARSFVQHNLDANGLPLRLYYITPVFRYERPQNGRYRQHHQFGVEFFGSDSVLMDFELIHFAYSFITKIGLKNFRLYINSIGCNDCRKNYIAALKVFVNDKLDKFCDTCKVRLDTNPMRILDCKVETCKQVLQQAPIISDYICDDCVNHQRTLTEQLKSAKIEYTINPHIVRGLDYYNRTVFEFLTTSKTLGNQSTICGGGRYDDLVQSLGGRPIGCVGFGLGIERLLTLMDEQKITFKNQNTPTISIICVQPEQQNYAIKLGNLLRDKGIKTDIDYNSKSIKSQLKRAFNQSSAFAIVIGQTEIDSGKAKLQNLITRQETSVDIDSFVQNCNDYLT